MNLGQLLGLMPRHPAQGPAGAGISPVLAALQNQGGAVAQQPPAVPGAPPVAPAAPAAPVDPNANRKRIGLALLQLGGQYANPFGQRY